MPHLAVLAGGLLAVPMSAATSSVTGTLTYAESIALTPAAVAVVTIIDTTAAADAGAVVGQQRINAPSQVPIGFAVVVDPSTLDTKHSYALFATITDGTNTWQNPVGEPVITGGPTSGIALTLPAVPATLPATASGTIVPPAGTVLSPQAVSIAALIKVETGTLVSRQVTPIASGHAQCKPGRHRVHRGVRSVADRSRGHLCRQGRIVDGGYVWQNRGRARDPGRRPGDGCHARRHRGVGPAPWLFAITIGRPEHHTATERNTATDRDADGATQRHDGAHARPPPRPRRRPRPDPDPDPHPDADPLAHPHAVAHPDREPDAGTVERPHAVAHRGTRTGTLTYKESYALSGSAFAVVALVRGSATATQSSIVTSEIYRVSPPSPFRSSSRSSRERSTRTSRTPSRRSSPTARTPG